MFSRPWTISMPLYRHIEPNAQILEFKCVPFVEELLYKDLELPQQQSGRITGFAKRIAAGADDPRTR